MLSFVTFAQESYRGELCIYLINYSGSFNITFTLTAIGAKWDDNYDLTENYEDASDTVNSNSDPPYYALFDHVLDPSSVNDTFAVALYKISAIENGTEQAYFYMDWRTSYRDSAASLDVYFDYDVGNKRFEDEDNTQTIDYSYQTLWDLNPLHYLETSGLENYWDNCLAITNNENDNPRLVWGPYPNEIGIYEYRIYRKYGRSQWDILDGVVDSIYVYTDTTVTINQPGGPAGTDVYYYVRGLYREVPPNPSETESTDTVEINVRGHEIEKGSEFEYQPIQNFEYGLEQNYPNPFNPSTVISWQSPVDDFVTLKVFDVLGREVTTLVSEYREAGMHFVEFNASYIPSGVYFYRIQFGNYSETRKFILQK